MCGLADAAPLWVATRAGLRLPPQAARTEGPPKGADAPLNQSREAHHPAWPLHSPRGGHEPHAVAAEPLRRAVADDGCLNAALTAGGAGRQ
jgi:hypothetical protein